VIVSNERVQHTYQPGAGRSLTTSVERLYPSEAYVQVRGKKHKAMANQLATVSKIRLQNRVGQLSASDLEKVEQAIRVH